MKSTRVLQLAGGFNFRELGGYQTENGRTIKWHRLLRASYLSDLTDEDQQALVDYGVKQVIDLRSKSEREQFTDPALPQVAHYEIPVFDDDETESSNTIVQTRHEFSQNAHSGYQRMLYVYRRLIVDEGAQQAYRQLFDCLMSSESGATIFHCSAGKDRTGIAAVFILSALGVPREKIFADYLLTNSASTRHIGARVAYAQEHKQTKAFQTAIHDLSTVQVDYLQQALSLIDYEYGGMGNYLHDILQLTPECIQNLKQRYLE